MSGKSINELWNDAEIALAWLNEKRNLAAHRGYYADYNTAAVAIYVCLKTAVVLIKNNLIDGEMPKPMFRQAKITAAWSDNPPKWVPQGLEAESSSFD